MRSNGFGWAPDYYLLNGGSHLKPPARISAPALTRHVALWIPPAPDGSAKSFEDRRADWLLMVDWFLASFARQTFRVWREFDKGGEAQKRRPHAFAEASSRGGPSAGVTLFRTRVANVFTEDTASPWVFEKLARGEVDQYRNEAFSLKFFFSGIPMKLRAALHAEFVSLTFIAELHLRAVDVPEDDITKRMSASFHAVAGPLSERFFNLSCGARNGKRDSDEEPREATELKNDVRDGSAYLFDGFWNDVWKHYCGSLDPADEIEVRPAPDSAGDAVKMYPPSALRTSIGSVFGDFRCAVLCGGMTEENGGLRWNVDRPFGSVAAGAPGLALADLTADQALALADSLVPFLEAPGDNVTERTAAGQAGEFRMGLEHTAARFLDGRALYLSSLAAQYRWTAGDGEGSHEPLRFLVVVPRRNRWQLGRLIERLNLLGALRLASLKDLVVLNHADESLRSLGQKIDQQEKDPRRSHGLNVELSAVGNGCDGGFLYRVERSRYYVATFRTLRKLLRIKRIEGYQPYDEFVDRRIASTWDFIDRLGRRYERARRRIDSINANLQEQALHDQADAQRQQTTEQTKLLQFAEVAAAIPIGYYGGHLLAGFVSLIAPAVHALWPLHVPPRILGAEARMFLCSIAAMAIYIMTLQLLKRIGDKGVGVFFDDLKAAIAKQLRGSKASSRHPTPTPPAAAG